MAIALWLLLQMRGRAEGVGAVLPPSIGRTRAPSG
jgi:hypothetical protein